MATSGGGRLTAGCGCRFEREARAHHDSLLAVESDPLGHVLGLVELAATWHELEYAESDPRIAPEDWIEFAASHEWSDSQRMADLMIALASLTARGVGPSSPRPLGAVIPLFPGSLPAPVESVLA